MRSCNLSVLRPSLSFVETPHSPLDVDFFLRPSNFLVANIDNGGREKFFNNFVTMVDVFPFGTLST